MTPEERAIRVRLVLRPLPGFSGPALVRLRRGMKALLRSFGWRAVTGELLGPAGAAEALDTGERATARDPAPDAAGGPVASDRAAG
jgi:hypothetical protein